MKGKNVEYYSAFSFSPKFFFPFLLSAHSSWPFGLSDALVFSFRQGRDSSMLLALQQINFCVKLGTRKLYAFYFSIQFTSLVFVLFV